MGGKIVMIWVTKTDVVSLKKIDIIRDLLNQWIKNTCYYHFDLDHIFFDIDLDFECPEFCPEIYEPVCGTDGNIYENECELLVQGCYTHNPDLKVKLDGKCKGNMA